MTFLVAQEARAPRLQAIWRDVKIEANDDYRFSLELVWDLYRPIMGFIGLNPSTADMKKPDQTCQKFYLFARREGCGGFRVANLSCVKSKDPNAALAIHDVGMFGDDVRDNNNVAAVLELCVRAKPIVACWGEHKLARRLAPLMLKIVSEHGHSLVCLGKTKAGHPNHPLYLPGDQPLEPYTGLA